MSSGKKDDLFIGKLLEETYQVSEEREEVLPANYDLFLQRSNLERNEFFDEYSIEFSYEEHLGCYRLNWKGSILDFPANWSVFEVGTSREIVLDVDNNQDYLFDVFRQLEPSIQKIIISKEEDRIVVVPVDAINSGKWKQLEREASVLQSAA